VHVIIYDLKILNVIPVKLYLMKRAKKSSPAYRYLLIT